MTPSPGIPPVARGPWTGDLEYVPVVRKRWRMSLLFVAMTSLEQGRPIRLANQPARMSPKFPLGTTKRMGLEVS